MKRFLFWLYLLVKRQIKNPAVIAFLVLLPIATAIITNVPQLNKTEKLKVGLVVSKGENLSETTAQALVNGEYGVEFYIVDNEEALREDILEKRAECGYIFANRLKEKLDALDFADCFTVIVNNSQFISSMTSEIVYSAMFKHYAIEVAINYIYDQKEFEDYSKKCEENLRSRYEKYLSSDEPFRVEIKILSEDEGEELVDIQQEDGTFPLKGILMVLVYIAGLFGGVSYYMDKEKGTFATLSKRYRILGIPLYSLIGCVMFAISVEITLIISGDIAGGFVEIAKSCGAMLIYVVAITLFTWMVGLLIRSAKGMIAVVPALLILNLVICPIFVNVAVYVPFVKYVRYLLLPYYML